MSVLHSATNDDYAEFPLGMSESLVRRRSAAVVAVSDEGAKSYARRFSSAPPPIVIKNGVNVAGLERSAAMRVASRKRLKLQGKRLILQVGRLSAVKQQHLTLRSVLPLMSDDEAVVLWFAGLTEDPAYEAQLRAAIRDSGFQERVRILGSRDDVFDLLACADLFVMPSRHEAHSIGMLEAIVAGAPIVCSDITAFGDAMQQPGVSAFQVDDVAAYSRACREMLAGPSRIHRDTSPFDISKTALSYWQLINELVEHTSAKPHAHSAQSRNRAP